MSISIIGAGAWGTTLSNLFAINNDVTLYVRDSEQAKEIQETRENKKYLPGFKLDEKINVSNDKNRLSNSEIVVYAIPSTHFREVLSDFSFLDPKIPFVSVTKGLEQHTHMRMSEVILDTHKNKSKDNIAVLSGPNLAVEIMERKPAATVVASSNFELAQAIQSKLVSKNFRVYTSTDTVGCEIAGIAKNVIAIGVGIGDGAQYGDNAKALVITRGLAEIKRLGNAIGGLSETFAGLAGIGDLIATCSSELSRNRTVGYQLGQGKTLESILRESNHIAEGVNSVKSLSEYAKTQNVAMPLVDAICNVIEKGNVTPDDVALLMARPAKSE